MESSARIQCPWCGELFELALDVSVREQQLITDCEICCRPMELRVHDEDGELHVDVMI